MFSTNIKNLFKGFALVSAMVFGVMLVSTTTASAQYPTYGGGYGTYGQRQNQDDRYNGRDRNGNQSARFAYQRGYKEGLRQARQDARNGGSVNSRYGQYGSRSTYGNNGSYGRGNHNGWGNNSAWQQAYNDGYNRGYNEGMNRFGNNGYNNNNRYNRTRRVISLPLPY